MGSKFSKDELAMMESISGIEFSVKQKIVLISRELGATWQDHLYILATPKGDEFLRTIIQLLITWVDKEKIKKKEELAPAPKMIEIDTDADPPVNEGDHIVDRNLTYGKIEWKLTFQNRGPALKPGESSITGYQFLEQLKQLKEKRLPNKAVAQYLYLKPENIPGDCKGKIILFPGTIVRHEPSKTFYTPLLQEKNSKLEPGWFDLSGKVTADYTVIIM